MALLTWLALAHAQTVVLEHRIPSVTELGFAATGVGGADAWTQDQGVDGGGPAGELRLSGGVGRGAGQTELSVGYGALLEAWTTGGAVDGQLLELTARNRAGPGLILHARGSALQEWLELGAAAAFVKGHWRLGLAPLVRTGPGLSTAGAAIELEGARSVLPRLDLTGAVRAAWHAEAAVPEIGSIRGGLVVAPTLKSSVGLGGSVLGAVGGDPFSVLGLPAGDSVVLRPEVWARLWASGALAVQVEGAMEEGWGSVRYRRFRAFAGLHLRLGKVHAPPLEPTAAGEVVLRYTHPIAEDVRVAGSFTGWEPLQMVRTERGWEVVIALPEGIHEYVYLVDGVPVVPPEASSWRDDGFGGRSGVLVVGPAPL